MTVININILVVLKHVQFHIRLTNTAKGWQHKVNDVKAKFNAIRRYRWQNLTFFISYLRIMVKRIYTSVHSIFSTVGRQVFVYMYVCVCVSQV